MLERFTWLKNSAFRWDGEGMVVYIDPWGTRDDDPPADVVFVTHGHYDHFDRDDIARIRKDGTKFVAPPDVADELTGEVTTVSPGDALEVAGVRIQTVPAYNLSEERLDFHPERNRWVGYILTLGGTTYYHAGDTDHTPELDQVRADVAFLPAGGHFTMDPVEAAGAARSIAPQVAVPMHFGFVSGSAQDGETFRREAEPLKVEVFTPVNPFERT
jgi:L-ascorbate metabolism protein UlaG (beta-lactamase superfamily)